MERGAGRRPSRRGPSSRPPDGLGRGDRGVAQQPGLHGGGLLRRGSGPGQDQRNAPGQHGELLAEGPESLRHGRGHDDKARLTYTVHEFIPDKRIQFRSENKSVIAVDTMSFRSVEAGTEVTYSAEFTFNGPVRFVAPLFKPAFERLGNQAEAGMYKALSQL